MNVAMSSGLNLTASDATGQQKFSINNFSTSARVSDLLKAVLARMGLASTDEDGRAVAYQAFNRTDGCHLRGDEKVGDVLREGDELSILPDVQAGIFGT